jgi:hypothetical protein
MIGVVGKVAADQGGRDQLDHRIPCDPPRPEIHDLTFPKSLHVNELAELYDIPANVVSITDQVGMAVLEVDGSTQSPGLPFTNHFLDWDG